MRVFGLSSCDTCKKAEKALRTKGMAFDVVDVRKGGVQPADIARFHDAVGEALLNRRSTAWRGLAEKARAGDPLALLAAHPTLMKRAP
jgi:arsenate reductase-like glutaredoxin family protein